MVKRITTPYELVHSDVCGPFATPTHKGFKYFILYIDDYSRYSDMYLLPNTLATTCMSAYNRTFRRGSRGPRRKKKGKEEEEEAATA